MRASSQLNACILFYCLLWQAIKLHRIAAGLFGITYNRVTTILSIFCFHTFLVLMDRGRQDIYIIRLCLACTTTTTTAATTTTTAATTTIAAATTPTITTTIGLHSNV